MKLENLTISADYFDLLVEISNLSYELISSDSLTRHEYHTLRKRLEEVSRELRTKTWTIQYESNS
jgi:hypothetical protein